VDVLLGVLCVLTLVAIVGHGIWILVAAIFRAMAGSSTSTPQSNRPVRNHCPVCDEFTPEGIRFCPNCGLDLDSRNASRIKRLRTAAIEVNVLAEQKELDRETANRVVSCLDQRVRDLHAPLSRRSETEAPTRAIPVPASPPPIPVARLVSPDSISETDTAKINPTAAPTAESDHEPRRSVFVRFMEERNILLGELVGGLLIVGCSIALVLTLWRSLEGLPYFPFLLSFTITAALFGAGQYTLHHWKLASTSRGLLIISLLLTPLNLLLLANPGTDAGGGWVDALIKIVAVLAFVGIVRAASRDLIGTGLLPGPIDRRWLLAFAVVGAPASAAFTTTGTEFIAIGIPLLCYMIACTAVLAGLTWYRGKEERSAMTERQGVALLIFVGLSLFALVAVWGLLVIRSKDVAGLLQRLAFPLSFAAVPIIEAGLLVHRRITGHAGLRTTGTGLAAAGTALLLVAILLAWPNSLVLACVATLIGAVFTREAWRESVPWFQAGAIPAFGVAAVLVVHGLVGRWVIPEGISAASWLQASLSHNTSGLTLTAFGLLLAFVAEVVLRLGSRPQAIAYAIGGLGAAAVGLLYASFYGLDEPWTAVGVHAVSATGLLLANVRWRIRALAELALWLVLTGTFWGLQAALPDRQNWWGLALATEALAFAILARVVPRRSDVIAQVRSAAVNVAVAAGIAACGFMLIAPGFPQGEMHTATLFLLAATGLILTRIIGQPWPAWSATVAIGLGLLHLTIITLDVKPIGAAVLLALLGHVTLVLATAITLVRPSRVRLLGIPFRVSGRVSSALAAPLLFLPSAGMAPEWAGFALWLAVLWFVLAWAWQERGTFSMAQVALAVATGFCALIWIERQTWWLDGVGVRDPRTWQAIGLALAILSLGWVITRRFASSRERLRTFWLRDPVSIDRLTVVLLVGTCLLLLTISVIPAAFAELTPVVQAIPITAPTEISSVFGPGTWLVLGLLALVLIVNLKLVTDGEPGDDATVLVFGVLAICFPIAWAGLFATELATASALRWGLALLFLLGTSALVFRESIVRALHRARFRASLTTQSTICGYALMAIVASVVVLLSGMVAAIGLNGDTPQGPLPQSIFASIGWTVSNVVPLALLVVGLAASAVRERSPGYAFESGLVFLVTVTGGYALLVITSGGNIGPTEINRLGVLAALSTSAWSLLWHAAERRVPGGILLTIQVGFGLAGVAVLAIVPFMLLLSGQSEPLPDSCAELGRSGWAALVLASWAAYVHAARWEPLAKPHILGFVAFVGGVFAACTAQPWDDTGRRVTLLVMTAVWSVAGLVITATIRGPWIVVIAVGIAWASIVGPTSRTGVWPIPISLALYALLGSFFSRKQTVGLNWQVGVLAVIGLTASLRAVDVAISSTGLAERLAGPFALLVLAVAIGLISELRVWSLVTAVVGIALTGWAIPDLSVPAIWLQRNAWTFVALTLSVIAVLEFLPRKFIDSTWASALRNVNKGLFPATLIVLIIVLIQQVPVFDPVTKRTPLTLTAVLFVLAAIAALIVMAFRFALRPAADPYRMPDSQRTIYVYLAELLIVMFFIHIRFNLPELFLGQAVRYWTFIVMLIAFIGVGLAELFERSGTRVLAIPMRRTGVLLPLIPLLAFWAKPPASLVEFAAGRAPGFQPFLGYLEKLPQHFDSYAWLWFLAGTLYGLVALSKRSFGWALLGALAVNAGLWALLWHNGVSAAVHPQVWVIPLALIILVSEHTNRRELQANVSAGLRYLGIGMLYISSSADLFIAGVGQSVWLPVILAVLCVIGIFAGIVLRVRAFLFLGVGFLVLDVFSMIWYAAVDRDQTWVWYVSGIVLGTAILGLFAVFEKRRNDVIEVVGRLRSWD
jgi:hypothetical protein